jgi:hypothetical protein
VLEGAGNAADDPEAERFPEGNRAFVRADHEVELQGAEAQIGGVFDAMLAQCTCDAASEGRYVVI